jgi:4-amino-4-deoxy-L-arabinose transferase-like glycosyltransferase
MRPWLIAPAVAAIAWASLVAQPSRNGWGIVFACVGAAVLLALAGCLPPRMDRPGGAFQPPPWGSVVVAAIGAGLAGVLLVASLRLFSVPARQGTAWLLYLAALACLVLPLLRINLAPSQPGPAVSWREGLFLLVVIAVGIVFRTHLLGSLPYGTWFDEAENGLQAIRILDDPRWRPVFVADYSQMPALPFYLWAAALAVFGRTILAVRLLTTLVGVASILAVWALARQLYGRWVAVSAACVLALMRWHVGFSRFGMTMIFVSLVAPLALLWLVRAVRTSSVRDAALAGLAVGIGAQFYYAMAVVPVVAGFAAVCHAVADRTPWRRALLVLVTGATVSLVAYAPVLQYAVRNQKEFAERFRTVCVVPVGSLTELGSVLLHESPRRQQALHAIAGNVASHVAMFHIAGDRTGRHNLSGEPMLEPVTGVLFLVGLLWCLLRPLDPRSWMLIVWTIAMLVPGVLSLAFEAPQAARTFGLTAVVALLTGLPLGRIVQVLAEGRRHWLRPALAAALATAALAAIARSSWITYFDRQLVDGRGWAEFSALDTKIAQVARERGEGADIFVPEEYLDTPTERFILGHPLGARPFLRSRDIPLGVDGRTALVFFGGAETDTVAELRRIYPGVRIEGFGPPRSSPDRPVMWIAQVPATDIANTIGWLLEVDDGAGNSHSHHLTAPVLDWSRLGVRGPASCTVRGVLRVSRDGLWGLATSSDHPADLAIDGDPVLSGKGDREGTAVLALGIHAITLHVDVASPTGMTTLQVRPPNAAGYEPIAAAAMFSPVVPATGLLGMYYANSEWRGAPARLQIDPAIAFYFHIVPFDRPFSVRWIGALEAPESGRYLFFTRSVDDCTVEIDRTAVVVNNNPDLEVAGSAVLSAGRHHIEVRYRAVNPYSQVYLSWQPPGRARALLPTDVLKPTGPRELVDEFTVGIGAARMQLR